MMSPEVPPLTPPRYAAVPHSKAHSRSTPGASPSLQRATTGSGGIVPTSGWNGGWEAAMAPPGQQSQGPLGRAEAEIAHAESATAPSGEGASPLARMAAGRFAAPRIWPCASGSRSGQRLPSSARHRGRPGRRECAWRAQVCCTRPLPSPRYGTRRRRWGEEHWWCFCPCPCLLRWPWLAPAPPAHLYRQG